METQHAHLRDNCSRSVHFAVFITQLWCDGFVLLIENADTSKFRNDNTPHAGACGVRYMCMDLNDSLVTGASGQ